MKAKDFPRLLLTAFVMGIFGYATVEHYSPAIEQTVVAIALLAVGYWLGSSEGSKNKTDMLEARPTGNPGDPVHTEEDA